MLVQDADYLDHVGPLGIWLALYYHGARAETIADALSFSRGDERAEAIARIRKSLNFDISVSILDQRVGCEENF